jgi:hypothetical protein
MLNRPPWIADPLIRQLPRDVRDAYNHAPELVELAYNLDRMMCSEEPSWAGFIAGSAAKVQAFSCEALDFIEPLLVRFAAARLQPCRFMGEDHTTAHEAALFVARRVTLGVENGVLTRDASGFWPHPLSYLCDGGKDPIDPAAWECGYRDHLLSLGVLSVDAGKLGPGPRWSDLRCGYRAFVPDFDPERLLNALRLEAAAAAEAGGSPAEAGRECTALTPAERPATEAGSPSPIAAAADAEPAGRSDPKQRMSAAEANRKAMELAKADRFFVQRSLREWAHAIGCSDGLVSELPLWKETMNLTGRGIKGKAPAPKAVGLTDDVEAVAGEGKPNDVLDQVIVKEDTARAKARWEALSPNRGWDELSPEEQRREIAASTEDEDMQRLIAEQDADRRADQGRKFRRRKRP